MKTIDERIDAGVAWLDDNVPDWLDRIDLARLDLSSECACVLGQTFAHVAEPCGRTGFDAVTSKRFTAVPTLAATVAGAYGFDGIAVDGRVDWGALTDAWRERIASLRAERQAVAS